MISSDKNIEQIEQDRELANQLAHYKTEHEREKEVSLEEEIDHTFRSLKINDDIQFEEGFRGSGKVGSIQNTYSKSEKESIDYQSITNTLSEIDDFDDCVKNISEANIEIVKNALRVICKKTSAQIASIFLISEKGALRRTGIYGFDLNGKEIPNNEFKFGAESYEIGKSFSGKAAESTKDSKYGKINFWLPEYLPNEDIELEFLQKYTDKIGDLKCVIAIPINGKNRTYGVLRVINKLKSDNPEISSTFLEPPHKKQEKIETEPFLGDDIRSFILITESIAKSISNFQKESEILLYKNLSSFLIQNNEYSKAGFEKLADNITESLVKHPINAYATAIVRVKEDDELKLVSLKLAEGISEKEREYGSRKRDDYGFLWDSIVDKQKRQLLEKIQSDHIHRFKNEQWIRENEFESYMCFPLLSKDRTLGTFSVYTGKKRRIDKDNVEFLQGIANLLASYAFKVEQEEKRKELEAQLLSCENKFNNGRALIDDEIKYIFFELEREWQSSTKLFVSINQRFMHPTYQKIIGLGSEVLPLLFRELSQGSSDWFWALKAITRQDPVPLGDRGKIELMQKYWINWAIENSYLIKD